MRSALVVPRHRIGLGHARAAGGHGGQHVLVDILAEHGGRLDDRALPRGQRGQQAADDDGEIR